MKKDNKNGCTLVETLVAIAVLLLAVAAPLSLATKSLNSSALSKQQITASFLAQEAMEYIRNARDRNVLKDGPENWLKGTGVKMDFCLNNKCQVDVLNNKIEKCIGSCLLLRYSESSGVYSYDLGNDTIDSFYTRTIEMNEIETDVEVAILVTVSWQGTNGVDYKVIARENLTNWQ